MAWLEGFTSRLPDSLVIFSRTYASTTQFKVSSPLSSIVWMLSLLSSRASQSDLSTYVATVFGIGAILLLVTPALLFWWNNRPFHIFIDWSPVDPDPVDRRLEHRGMIRADEGNVADVPASATIRVYLDEKVDDFAFKFKTTGQISVAPQFAPINSEYDNDARILECDSVDTHDFYFPLKIAEQASSGGELEREIEIVDTGNRERTLLQLDIL